MTETELTNRLERLERDNRRLKGLGVAALVLAAALGAVYAARPVPEKITAREFDVADASGNVRIRLSVSKLGEAGVTILDRTGVARAAMTLTPLGPLIGLGLHKLHGVPRAPLGAMAWSVTIEDSPFGPAIMLGRDAPAASVGMGVSPSGQPSIELTGPKASDRARMSLSPGGAPTVELSDSEGYSLDLGSMSVVAPTTGTTEQTSAASIVMFGNDKKHHVIWRAP
ncbi:MAG: hypothetical protein ACRD3O_21165 [Terriglobia bacterium]